VSIQDLILYVILPIAVTAIVSILVTYYVLRRTKKLKLLIVPQKSIIGALPKDIQEKTKIIYDTKEIKNLASTTIKLVNTGFSAIRDTHILKPIQIIFDNTINLMEYRILKQTPERKFNIQIENNVSSINFEMMNPSDFVIIQYVHSGIPNESMPKVNPISIENLKKINTVRGELSKAKGMNIFNCLRPVGSILVTLVLLIILQFASTDSSDRNMFIVISGFFGLFILSGAWDLYKLKTRTIFLGAPKKKKEKN
jgi:hypothetical protein